MALNLARTMFIDGCDHFTAYCIQEMGFEVGKNEEVRYDRFTIDGFDHYTGWCIEQVRIEVGKNGCDHFTSWCVEQIRIEGCSARSIANCFA